MCHTSFHAILSIIYDLRIKSNGWDKKIRAFQGILRKH